MAVMTPDKRASITYSRPTRTEHDIEQSDLKLQKQINREVKINQKLYTRITYKLLQTSEGINLRNVYSVLLDYLIRTFFISQLNILRDA